MNKPLAGVRIADFTLHAAGPFCTHLLSQLGAECIKIESSLRLDIFRKPHPVYGRMEAASFDQVSSNKLSATINLKDRRGVELAKKLVALSDVVAESFRPGVMERLGLGYGELTKLKPDIVMVSVSSCGQTGPDSNFAGYAPLFSAWGGLGYMTGFRDGPPVEIRHVMDHSVGVNAALATLAAILHQRTTGRGQHIDVAAREVASSFIGEALLQAAAGESPTRAGNDHATMSPHGAYPCSDEDSWISIAVGNETEWQGLVTALQRPELRLDGRFANAAARVANRRQLDQLIASWTVQHKSAALAGLLQANGVPACPSMTPADLAHDPHLRQRGTVLTMVSPSGDERAVIGSPWRFSGSTSGIERSTPELGEHNRYVFGELLGLSEETLLALIREKVIH